MPSNLHFLSTHIPKDWASSEKWASGLETFDWEQIPPRGQKADYKPGEVIGSFLNIMDKKGGVEPGFMSYVRDEQYEEVVANIILEKILKIPVEKLVEASGPNDSINNDPIIHYFKKYLQTMPGDPKQLVKQLASLKEEGVIPQEELKNIHEIFRNIEKNCGSEILKEIQLRSKNPAVPKEMQLQKFLIKQDYKDPTVTNSVSISSRRAKTTAGAIDLKEKYGSWAQGLRAKAHNLGRLQKKSDANKNAFMESMSTRLAVVSGMKGQEQGIIKGSYENPPHSKLLTITKFQEGFSDFEGRLMGGSLKNGNYIVQMELNAEGKKVPKKNEEGYLLSDNAVKGLGENLVAVLRQDDFDFFGSKGGNKGIVNNQFFGIDFGHAYERDNKIVSTLNDDFSFKQPGKPIKNVSILYDNPLSEKMKGIILLCKLRGRTVPDEVVESYGKEFAEKYKALKTGSDYLIFEEHQVMAAKLEMQDPIGYKGLREEVSARYKRAREADQKILEVFDKRINLTAQQLDFIDNMEKLCSETSNVSPHGNDVHKNKITHLTENLSILQLDQERLKKQYVTCAKEAAGPDQQKKLNIIIKKLIKLDSEIKETQKALDSAINKSLKAQEKNKNKSTLNSKNTEKEYKKSAVVKLNHLKVNPKSRVSCQLIKNTNDNSYTISLEMPKIKKGLLERLLEKITSKENHDMKVIAIRILRLDPSLKENIKLEGRNLKISCKAEKLKSVMEKINEKDIENIKHPVTKAKENKKDLNIVENVRVDPLIEKGKPILPMKDMQQERVRKISLVPAEPTLTATPEPDPAPRVSHSPLSKG